MPAWRALRVVAERGGRGRSERARGAVRRRDDELRLLKDLFHATGREQRAAARLDHRPGRHRQEPAGLGVREVRRRGRRGRLVARRAARRPTARGSRSGRWARWSAARAGLLETDDEATTARPRSRRCVEQHVPDEAERRWIEPALLALLGVGEAPARRARGAVRGLAHVLRAHRGDGHGRAGLRGPALGRRRACSTSSTTCSSGAAASRSCIVTLARPELLERRPDWGAGERNFLALGLEPLTARPMRELLAGPRARACPETAVRSIVERAEGIPLYAVETVRMLVADGRLRGGDGALRAGRRPRRARGAGDAARRSSRPGSTRSTRPTGRSLQDAAVLGQSFTLGRPGRRRRRRAGEPRAAPARPRPARARSTRTIDPRSPERGQYALRPGAHPRGRLQHAGQARPARAAPRRGALLRGARRRRAGGRAGRPLPRRIAGSARRTRGRCRRDPGAARADRSGRPSDEPRFARGCHRIPRTGAPGHGRPSRPRADPGTGREGRHERRSAPIAQTRSSENSSNRVAPRATAPARFERSRNSARH